jgi:hypothetical protein
VAPHEDRAAIDASSQGRSPEQGELILFPETADIPVEWAVLGRDPGRPGLVLVVPADTNPKVGTADLEVPVDSPVAPLALRCGFGVWIGEARLDIARRTGGALDPEDVSAARRVWEARERGEPVGSLLAEETDADPEYRDWIEDVLIPARAALIAAPAKTPVVPLRRRPAFFGNPFALAASVLLMVSLGLGGGVLWQDRRIEVLARERARTEQELRQERERLAGELRRAEKAHRRELNETERKAQEARQRDWERIAELEQRLEDASRPESQLNVPFVALSPRDPVRGEEIEELALTAKTGLFFLILSVVDTRPFSTYRLEMVNKKTGRVVWKGEGLKTGGDLNEVSLLLPRDALSPGDYRLRLYGLKNRKAEQVGEYELRVAHK